MNDRVEFEEPEPSPHIFRQAALDARHVSRYGSIILIRPLSISMMTILALVMTLIVLSFLTFARYTRRSTVDGVLSPVSGIVRIYSPQAGVILDKHMIEGQQVNRTDLLYTISSDRLSLGADGSQASVSAQVRRRHESLIEELAKTKILQRGDLTSLEQKISGMVSELSKVNDQIIGQRARVGFAQAAVQRSRDLVNQHFISAEQLDQKSMDLLDQQSRLQALERDRITLERDLTGQRRILLSMPLTNENALAALNRNIETVNQELTESEAKRGVEIRATESGSITLGAAETGQFVDTSTLLAVIIPRNTRLQAYLYAPSKAIAFIKPGDVVQLRYDTYPYQQFGSALGEVLAVAQTALPASEFPEKLSAGRSASGSTAEPLYRITVALQQQWITAEQAQLPLQAGMTLSADVLLDSRRLIEWVLEPLLGVTRKT